MTYHLIARPTTIDRILNFFSRNTPIPPEPNVATLYAELMAFKAAHDQQISALGVQIEHERTERRDARRYAEMLQGSLETVTREASTFATELYNMRETNKQTDERLKWQADTINGLKHRITQLEELLSTKENDNARLTQRITVVELYNEHLLEENAEFRAAASTVGVDVREIELRVQERRNQLALRREVKTE